MLLTTRSTQSTWFVNPKYGHRWRSENRSRPRRSDPDLVFGILDRWFDDAHLTCCSDQKLYIAQFVSDEEMTPGPAIVTNSSQVYCSTTDAGIDSFAHMVETNLIFSALYLHAQAR